MSLVLDTHVWLWFLSGEQRLGRPAKKAIEDAIGGGVAVISAITPWEVSMLVAERRLTLSRPTSDWLTAYLSCPGFSLHPLSVSIAVDSNALPGSCHGDPADRIIIATARVLDMPLVTADREILHYASGGHVKAIDAMAGGQ